MPPNMRPLMRVARIQRFQSLQRAFASSSGPLPGGTPGESPVQAMPLGPYYESILTKPQPIPEAKPEGPPTSSPKSPRSTTKKGAAAAKSKEEASSSSGTTTSTSTSTSTAFNTSTATSTNNPDTSASTITKESQMVPPQPTSTPAPAAEKARIIFGSRLAGPADSEQQRADRLQALRERSVVIAGVRVPPRPDEPDNCCMSGCVNCVWDRYRDDMEAWADASARAEAALQAQKARERERESKTRARARGSVVDVDAVKGDTSVSEAMSSVDDDGGGSETNWGVDLDVGKDLAGLKTERPKIAKDLWDDELYKNVPVGIREFMKTEKRLKKKHEEEGTFGA